MWFLSQNMACDSWHMWSKPCGFIHFDVQYVGIIVAYIIFKFYVDIGYNFKETLNGFLFNNYNLFVKIKTFKSMISKGAIVIKNTYL